MYITFTIKINHSIGKYIFDFHTDFIVSLKKKHAKLLPPWEAQGEAAQCFMEDMNNRRG